MTDHTKNELAWALEATANPPYLRAGMERNHVEREYRRFHALLRELDNEMRGWQAIQGFNNPSNA